MDQHDIREALKRHWAASDANDFDVEHDIYREDALLEYPQSGERVRGRHNIQASRVAQPNSKRFAVQRIVGCGDIWVTEFILAYDGRPSYSVSIMEFGTFLGGVCQLYCSESRTRVAPFTCITRREAWTEQPAFSSSDRFPTVVSNCLSTVVIEAPRHRETSRTDERDQTFRRDAFGAIARGTRARHALRTLAQRREQ
jgi:hypothetical protein